MPELPCPDPVTVDVEVGGGAIHLVAEPRATATVEVTPLEDSETARQAATTTRVELVDGTLLVHAPEGANWLLRRLPKLRVTVAVPTGSRARIRTASADTTCRGGWEQVRVASASGDASVAEVTGDLVVNTASGDVRAERVGGRLTVKTVSGDVWAARVDGPVDVKSATGDIEIDTLGADLRAGTVSGDVRVGAARRGRVQVHSASGDTRIGVVAGTGVWLDLTTLSGRTSSDLEPGAEPLPHDLSVTVYTVSGDIAVHRVTQPAAA